MAAEGDHVDMLQAGEDFKVVFPESKHELVGVGIASLAIDIELNLLDVCTLKRLHSLEIIFDRSIGLEDEGVGLVWQECGFAVNLATRPKELCAVPALSERWDHSCWRAWLGMVEKHRPKLEAAENVLPDAGTKLSGQT